jgi:hypothetical protein
MAKIATITPQAAAVRILNTGRPDGTFAPDHTDPEFNTTPRIETTRETRATAGSPRSNKTKTWNYSAQF